MSEENNKNWFGKFLDVLLFLNLDLLTRNQNIHLEKKHSELRQKEIEREVNLKEKDRGQEERNQRDN